MLLYDDAMKRKQRKDNIYSKCLDSECTFQPDLIKGGMYDSFYSENPNFVARLAKPQNGKSRSKIRYMHEANYDKQTGQKLFHPKIGRPPLAKKEGDNIPVSEKLYQDGRKRKEMLEEKVRNMGNHINRKVVQDKSEELLDHKKARKFHFIFQLIDSDGDGIISAEQIDISKLTPEMLQIFTPLF
jgi:hypothetical protein